MMDTLQEAQALFKRAREAAILSPEIRAEMRKGLKIVRKIRTKSIELKKVADLDENKIKPKELERIQHDLRSRLLELENLINDWRVLADFPGRDEIQIKLDTGMYQIREEFQRNWPVFEEKVKANA